MRLGPYEILAPLGAGGMGEVYRARDTRLSREVAVKVLPAAFAADPPRMRRFEQEARAASALNHPNIVTVFDTGLHEGSPFLVTELLEGQTLRQRLEESGKEGGIPQRKALDYAQQIARGLAAAHAKGITHRDLKPENLFISRDGNVKILDFGLAKVAPEGIGEGPTELADTLPGTVMGTAGYMSPEQVRGLPADHRSDIFSFGAVLYEMLSGQRAFRAGTSAETMAMIILKDPPPLPAGGALDLLVRRCLEKDCEERFQSVRDLGFALQAQTGSEIAATEALPPAPRRALTPLWALAVLAALAAGYFLHRSPLATQPVFHQITYRRGTVYSARFAPDGQTVVYGARWDGQPLETYAVSREYPDSRPLGLAANLLSVSSAGELAVLKDARFFAHYQWTGTLASAPLVGGAARELMENVREADHAADGRLAVVIQGAGEARLEFPPGKVLYQTTGWISHPRISPQGDRVAFLDHPFQFDDLGSVVVVDLSGKKTILSASWGAAEGVAWNPRGNEVWFSAVSSGETHEVRAATLDGRVREVLAGAGALMLLDIARDGRLLVASQHYRGEVHAVVQRDPRDRDLSWLDGSVAAHLSADGKSIVFSEQSEPAGPRYSVALRKIDGSPVVRLGEGSPTGFSPDGKSVLSILPTTPAQYVVVPTGAGSVRVLDRGTIEISENAAWFPDGKRILFVGRESGKPSHFYLQDLSGGVPRVALQEDVLAYEELDALPMSSDGKTIPCFRPDRKWWLCSLDGGSHHLLTGVQENEIPLRWSSDGRSLFVINPKSLPLKFYKVEAATGRRQLWKEWSLSDPVGLDWLLGSDITPDGQTIATSFIRQLSDLFIVEGVK
jgi:Tol biopolymer transport system component